MGHRAKWRRAQLMAAVAVAAALARMPHSAAAAAVPVATFYQDATGNVVREGRPGSTVQDVLLSLEFTVPVSAPAAQVDGLVRYLGELGVYAPKPSEGEDAFLLAAVRVVALSREDGRWSIQLLGRGPARGVGTVDLTCPSGGWQFRVEGQGVSASTISIDYDFGEDWVLPAFASQVAPLGYGAGGFSFSASGDGVVHRGTTSLTTLSLDVLTPIGTPTDVEDTPGANDAASRENPGRFLLALNHNGYRKGHGKYTYGLRLRADGPLGSLRGAEGVLYLQPLMGWFDAMHGFYGVEAEAGVRNGDEEWESLTMKAPDRGSAVARVGAVVEWAPMMGGVNRDLSQGLRFFVRGRAWADMYDNDSGARAVRLRPFVDAELFTNFGAAAAPATAQWRVFLRGDAGYIPPDLTTYIHRAWVGVGAAF
jgi:hypothetical protein